MEEKQMKTLGGYEIVDEKAREDILTVSEKADEAYSLAKGATKAFVYDTYSDMIAELNALDKAELLVNYHIMIREVCVPDLWISGISDEHVEYTYTSNEDFITDLTEDGVVQVGYFVLSALETQKVDLEDFVKKTDYMSKDNYGVAKMADNSLFSTNGKIGVNRASENDIKTKANPYSLVPSTMIDLLVKVGMTTNSLEWTDDEKALARELLGSVGSNNVHADNGLAILGNGQLIISPATKSNIDDRSTSITATFSQRKPVTLGVLDYAVKKALSDCKLSGDDVWTEEEKAKALETLGGLKKIVSADSLQRVYAIGQDGAEKTLKASENPFTNALVLFGQGGIVKVGTPTADNHATTKKYVDDLVGSVESILTELHTHAESLIGGEA